MDKPELNDYEDLLPPEDNFGEEEEANNKNGNAAKK